MKETARITLVTALIFLTSSPSFAASREPVRATHGMVASVSGIASEVGVEIMKKGGNAVDAAVAVGLALAVVWPSAGNIGGGGFMVIRKADGSAEVIDYRERAPLAATRDMYLDKEGNVIKGASTIGHLGVGVPGTIAGFALAMERHGSLSWKEVVEPARRLAEEGFVVSYAFEKSIEKSLEKRKNVLGRFEESSRIYLRDGDLWNEGEVFKQPDLARTFARVKEKGPREFYEGETAKLIVEEMKRGGGQITLEDLATYEPAIREPLRGSYRGYEILAMPPPSSGGALLIQMLHMLEGFDLSELGHDSAKKLHLLVETQRRAFADRAEFMGDTDFVEVPLEGLMSREYAEARRATIDMSRATPSAEIGAGSPTAPESTETTHYSIVDAAGNMVSNTYTLNSSYGSGLTIPGTGILMNNEMDDFTSKPGVPNYYGAIQSENNAIAPKKRPLSSMTPAIVLKDGKALLAVGSPGGTTIINTVLQVILNVIDHDMNIREAIEAPRFHHQWLPDEIEWEPRGLNDDTRAILEAMGHVFEADPKLNVLTFLGDVHVVMIDPETGIRLGASDARRGGQAVGY